ncbi:AmmeMemoRadiSam system protein A [Lachnobacterium bovis]|uniref:AmmeMemoRadiSam system protein A n=1 Tax=Lachnobacterium bovis TaxID=140626 RepID=UPI0004880F05|nr:AmmeMemoRadiSam system protein A [Lachnobacterium bovis]
MSVIKNYILPHPPIMIPQIGKGDEVNVESTIKAISNITDEIAQIKPDTIVIISDKAPYYSDYIHMFSKGKKTGDLSEFGAKEIEFTAEYDIKLQKNIDRLAKEFDFPAGLEKADYQKIDYATIIMLYCLVQKYVDFNIVNVGLSNLSLEDHYTFGKIIKKASDELDRKVVCIASCDTSRDVAFSDEFLDIIKENPNDIFKDELKDTFSEFDVVKALAVLNGTFGDYNGEKNYSIKSNIYNFENPFEVGYLVAGFEANKKGSADVIKKDISKYDSEDECIKLARNAVETFLQTKDIVVAEEIINTDSDLFKEKAAVFVSIYNNDNIRGCIGSFSPIQKSIAHEIVANAINAATRDVRFMPITAKEIKNLSFVIDVIHKEQKVNLLDELDQNKYGVIIVSKDGKKGIILPNQANIDSVQMQLSILKQQVGLPENAKFGEDYELSKFEIQRHGAL